MKFVGWIRFFGWRVSPKTIFILLFTGVGGTTNTPTLAQTHFNFFPSTYWQHCQYLKTYPNPFSFPPLRVLAPHAPRTLPKAIFIFPLPGIGGTNNTHNPTQTHCHFSTHRRWRHRQHAQTYPNPSSFLPFMGIGGTANIHHPTWKKKISIILLVLGFFKMIFPCIHGYWQHCQYPQPYPNQFSFFLS